jgi:hypothetical protein
MIIFLDIQISDEYFAAPVLSKLPTRIFVGWPTNYFWTTVAVEAIILAHVMS